MTAGGRRPGFAAALFVGLLLAQGCQPGETAHDTGDATEFYQLSGAAQRADLLIEFFVGPLHGMRDRWTPEQFSTAKAVIVQQFSPAAVEARVVAKLRDATDSPHFQPTLTWLRSETAQRVNSAAGATLSAEGLAEIQAFLAASEASPPSPERLSLIERYDRTTQVSRDLATEMLLATYGVALMVESLNPPGERRSRESLKRSFLPEDDVLAPIFAEFSAISSRFAFRDVSDQDLAAFVAQCESEAGQWYHRTTSSAFLGSIEEITDGLGDAFEAALAGSDDP